VSWTFRPPTDNNVSFVGGFDSYGFRDDFHVRLFRFFVPGPQGRNVFKLVAGGYTENDPSDPSLVEFVYYGGHEYQIDDAERLLLIAAGYGANIEAS